MNSLIQSDLSDDLIQTFLAVQISSLQSMFFKGSHEDAIWKNPDAYNFMRSICEHSTFSNNSPTHSAKETLIKILISNEIITNINLPLSHHDDPHKDCWLHPIKLCTNLYEHCYENALEGEDTKLSPNFFDLAQVGVRLIENNINFSDSGDKKTFMSYSEYLLWNMENTYSLLINKNKSKNLEHSRELTNAYSYLVREILLSNTIRPSRKLSSLLQLVATFQFKMENKETKKLLLKEHQGAADSEEVRSIILELHKRHQELLPYSDSSDTMTLSMIPILFSKDN